ARAVRRQQRHLLRIRLGICRKKIPLLAQRRTVVDRYPRQACRWPELRERSLNTPFDSCNLSLKLNLLWRPSRPHVLTIAHSNEAARGSLEILFHPQGKHISAVHHAHHPAGLAPALPPNSIFTPPTGCINL